MNVRFYVVLSLLAGCLAGCPHNRYKIEMKPSGPALERTLSISRIGDRKPSPAKPQGEETKATTSKGENLEPVPDDELAHISKVYPESTIEPDAEIRTFRIKFTGRTPDDVGGAGSYRRFATRMGYASIYVERFRGDDNPAIAVTGRFQAVDELTDLLIGWFQSEMGQDERFGQLRDFMDKDLRRDLKNASMYLWLQGLRSLGDKAGDYEMPVRLVQYFMEQKYFSLEGVPAMTRVLANENEDGNVTEMLELVQRFIASKMGIRRKEAIPDSLKFLSSAKAAEKSLTVYLRSTGAFKEKMREWKKWEKTDPKASEPEPLEIFQNLADKAFYFELDLFGDNDELLVKLAVPAKPILTNGEWNEKGKNIAWSGTLENRAETYRRLPVICYAVWAVPDRNFQRKYFGKVVLADEALLEYCLWRNGLTDREAGEWDDFIARCRPGKSLAGEIEKFRFSDDPAPSQSDTQPDSTSRAGGIIKNIIEGLQSKN